MTVVGMLCRFVGRKGKDSVVVGQQTMLPSRLLFFCDVHSPRSERKKLGKLRGRKLRKSSIM